MRGHRALRHRYGHQYPPAYAPESSRYVIYGLVPKRGGGHLKKRHLVGRARDAHEALVRLFELVETQRASGVFGHAKWTYIIVDTHGARGKLAPVVSESELRQRKAAGQ